VLHVKEKISPFPKRTEGTHPVLLHSPGEKGEGEALRTPCGPRKKRALLKGEPRSLSRDRKSEVALRKRKQNIENPVCRASIIWRGGGGGRNYLSNSVKRNQVDMEFIWRGIALFR